MKMSALEYISYAFFPRRCALCGKVVPPDMPVCDRCEADLEYVKGELCPRCGREKKYCSCSSHRRFFESQTAPFYYSGAAKRSVHALKFDGCVQNAERLARFMSDSVKKNFAGVKFDLSAVCPCRNLRSKGADITRAHCSQKRLQKSSACRLKKNCSLDRFRERSRKHWAASSASAESSARSIAPKTRLQKMPQFCSATIYQQRERHSTSAQSSCFCAAQIKYIASARR